MGHGTDTVSPEPQIGEPGLDVDHVLAIELLETLLKLFQAGPCHGGRGCFLVYRGFRHAGNDVELSIVQPFDRMRRSKN